jgi:hypothetical protein
MCRRYTPGPRAMYELYPDETILIPGKEGYRELQKKTEDLQRS